ncbi:MAG: hypothetical protein AB1757_24935 [Acidobacteriota bacterium]
MKQKDEYPPIDFAILTAIEIERKAVCEAFELSDKHRIQRRGRWYWRGRVELENGYFYEIVVTQPTDMSNIPMALLTQEVIEHWEPQALLLAGIAAAASNKVGLGDIILGRQIYYYERGKITPTGKSPEPIIVETDVILLDAAIKSLEWTCNLTTSRPDNKNTIPQIHVGAIACGEKVIADKSTRKLIAEPNRKILAIEMESYGFAEAVRQSLLRPRFLVIRSICDRADPKKNDKWHSYAAAAVASFVKHYIKGRPLEPRSFETIDEKLKSITSHSTSESLYEKPLDTNLISNNLSEEVKGSVNAVDSQLEDLVSALSQEKDERIDEIREKFKAGKVRDAYNLLQEMQNESSWKLLHSSVRAKALRAMVSFTLDIEDDFDKAKDYASQARELAPQYDDSNVRALLLYYDQKILEALHEVTNPKTTDAFNLKVHFLLILGRVDEAFNCLEKLPSEIIPDIETKRLKALALIIKGELQEAENELREVISQSPHRDSVQALSAILDYFSGLSPAVVPKHLVNRPEPMDWTLVKQDEQSQERFRIAEQKFLNLITNTQRDEGYKESLEIWRLACLANDLTRQEEAITFCKELLLKDPANHHALIWAIVRDFNIDLSVSEDALRRSILGESEDADKDASIAEKIIVLIVLYRKSGRTGEALELLEQQKELFKDIGAENRWAFWKSQILVLSDQPEKAITLATRINDEAIRRRTTAMALQAIAARTNDWQPYFEYLEECYRETGGGDYLFELCYLKAKQNDWIYILHYIPDLIERVSTPYAIHLAATSLWYANAPEKALELLDAHIHKFPKGILPSETWRLRIHCQVKTGNLSSAIKDAEGLVHEDDSTENLITLLEILRQVGDIKGLLLVARRIINREDVNPRNLIYTARLVKLEDINLAKDFWHRAKERAIFEDPDFVANLIMQGFELGLEEEVGPLFLYMQKFAEKGEGPMRVYDIVQVSDWSQKRTKFLEEVWENYSRGNIPIHFLANQQNIPMVNFFHGIPENNRTNPDPIRQPIIFARHGGKIVNRFVAENSRGWRLHLDITSLILAADLGILDKLEQQFSPIRISKEVPHSLRDQQEKLKPHQPTRILNNKNILKLLEQKRLKPFPDEANTFEGRNALSQQLGQLWAWAFAKSHEVNGCVVDFLPLTKWNSFKEIVSLSDEEKKYVINCRTLVESLKGKLSITNYEKTLNKLGQEGTKTILPDLPPLGSPLFLVKNIADVLVGANLLEIVCDNFQVFVDPTHIQYVKGENSENERRAELEEWLKSRADRLSLGLQNGLYEFVVPLRVEEVDGGTEEPEINDLDFNSVKDMLAYPPHEGDVFCIDDRFVNSYSRRDNVPIIGMNEILLALFLKNEISESEFYEKLLRLRAGNFRYIPINSKEILYHLSKASVSDGVLIETKELSIIRRYLAACFLDSERLQRPPMPEGSPNPFGEMAFVQETVSAIKRAIVAGWVDESVSLDIAEARADWLLNNLYTGAFGAYHLTSYFHSRTIDSDINLLGLDLSEFFILGKGIYLQTNIRDSSRRRHFFLWLDSRLTSRRFKSDPQTLIVTTNCLKQLVISSEASRVNNKESEKIIRAITQIWILDLPESLRRGFETDPNILNDLGIQTSAIQEIDSYVFTFNQFWTKFEKVINGHEVQIIARNPHTKLTFIRVDSERKDNVFIQVKNEAGEVVGRWTNPLWRLLSKDRREREKLLRINRFWFDCDKEVFDKETKKIASLKVAVKRVERVLSWQNKSMEFFYQSLHQKLLDMSEFQWEDLIPTNFEGLLQHYRLTELKIAEEDFPTVLSKSSLALLEEEGLVSTIERLACLPVQIPENVIKAVSMLPSQERIALIEDCLVRFGSPVSILNLIDIVLRSAPDDEVAIKLAQTCLSELCDDEKGKLQFQLFKEILRFVNDEFGYSYRNEAISIKSRLAMIWAHTSRLHNIFHCAAAIPDKLAEGFKRQDRQMSLEIVNREPLYWNDILHPYRINRTHILVHGLTVLTQGKNSELPDTISVAEVIKRILSGSDEEAKSPLADLFNDSGLRMNALNSYLGGERFGGFSCVIKGEEIEIPSSNTLHEIVRQALENLKENPNQSYEWIKINAIVGDSPIYEDLQDDFMKFLEDINIESIYKVDTATARVALRIAASQLIYEGKEELRSRFEESLLRLIKFELANNSEKALSEKLDEVEFSTTDTLNTALMLSSRTSDSQTINKLLSQIIYINPGFADYFAYFSLKSVLELPVSQLQGLWQVLLTLRACSKNAL